MKRILIIGGGIVGGILFIVLCMGLFVRKIARHMDCESYNIDNIELRTETNIPDLSASPVCLYDTATKVKSNYFIIDTGEVKMQEYIQQNKFTKIETHVIPVLSSLPRWNEDINKPERHGRLYTKNGSYIGEESGNMDTWLYLLDSATGEMWMEVIRSKHH